jgi:MFS family permease
MAFARRLIRSVFLSPGSIPTFHQRNFFLLYCDVAFWGILNGTTLTFLAVYAARQGATGTQVGLIGAIPAIVTLMLALPTGHWLNKKSIHQSVVWTSIASRIFYLLLAPLPFLLGQEAQPWAIILIVLLMTIPGTATAIGFQSLFALTVPDEWRAHVTGIRNAILSITTTLAIIISGEILTSLEFPTGYVFVFLAGFLGAIFSSVSLLLIRVEKSRDILDSPSTETPDLKDGNVNVKIKWLRMDIIRGKFGLVIFLLFLFHLAQYLPIPVFPLFQVNYLKFSDQYISLGSSVFNMAVFLGSTQLERISKRFGNKNVVGVGILFLAFYPGILSFTNGIGLYMVASVVGGLASSMVGGGIYNFLLEYVPVNGTPPYFAFYNMALNAAILIGSMVGPLIAGQIGFVPALMIFAVGRFLSGAAILKWG